MVRNLRVQLCFLHLHNIGLILSIHMKLQNAAVWLSFSSVADYNCLFQFRQYIALSKICIVDRDLFVWMDLFDKYLNWFLFLGTGLHNTSLMTILIFKREYGDQRSKHTNPWKLLETHHWLTVRWVMGHSDSWKTYISNVRGYSLQTLSIFLDKGHAWCVQSEETPATAPKSKRLLPILSLALWTHLVWFSMAQSLSLLLLFVFGALGNFGTAFLTILVLPCTMYIPALCKDLDLKIDSDSRHTQKMILFKAGSSEAATRCARPGSLCKRKTVSTPDCTCGSGNTIGRLHFRFL